MIRRLPLRLAICFTVVAAFAPAALAQPPYEPNDSLLTAAGPLANNSTYTAADETENDTDYYYFYVTTPSTAQLTFTLTNLGGGTSLGTEVTAEITDSHGDQISYVGSVEAADYATKSISLEAGKYYVRIYGSWGYGASYKLATSGTEGAFGDYATIQANCAAATAPVATYQAQLAAALARLKKAEARWHQLRYTHRWRAKRRAKARYLRAKETVAAERRSLKAAEAGQKPWCFIPL